MIQNQGIGSDDLIFFFLSFSLSTTSFINIYYYAITILLRGLVAKKVYLTVNPLESILIMLQHWIVGKKHYKTTQRVKQTLQHSKKI